MKTVLEKGQKVRLIGPDDEILIGEYVFEEANGSWAKISDSNGTPLRTMLSRIVPSQEVEDARCELKTEKEEAAKESTKMAQEENCGCTNDCKCEESEKKTTKVSDQTPFDFNKWIKENGGDTPVHLVKTNERNFGEKKLATHIIVNASAGLYYSLNTYTMSDGTVFSNGIQKYPLKGKRFNESYSDKDGNNISKTKVGKKTADELVADKKKNGYVEA